MTDVMKEKLNPLVEGAQKISSKPKEFYTVFKILFITSFCETRKINYIAIRVLFLLLNFWKSRKCVGALKIIFQRGCAINN